MDFEGAAARLARDQSKLNGRRKVETSSKAAREAAFRKTQQAKLAEERLRQRLRIEYLASYFRQCERALGVKPLASNSAGGLQLNATSIHGEGDKIALPPSVLETLTASFGNDIQQQPWTFRIGILNPEYAFPASPVLQILPIPNENDDYDEDDEDDMEDTNTEAYLDELNHKYLAYTHATVVEFTQDEGHVGLPAPVARALISQATSVETTRTKDPAGNSETMDENDDEDEKTPGHLAWGVFDVPVAPIEISLVQLPKGETARLVPTEEAIQNGFYGLKDIKLVLEQSLIRTRATLSVNDLIHTWHRGVKFDLTVMSLTPALYGAVSCINTDIEIEFGQVGATTTTNNATMQTETPFPNAPLGRRLDNGRASVPLPSVAPLAIDKELAPEPPADQKDYVVIVQIRADGCRGQRRFDAKTGNVRDLFAFAASLGVTGNFQLVTRFPRRVFTLSVASLQDAGISAGQELFMVEKI